MYITHKLFPFLIAALLLGLGGCSNNGPRDGAPDFKDIDLDSIPNAVPKNEPRSKYGNPAKYEVRGKTYWVKNSGEGYVKRGKASWYGTKFHGRRTSSGTSYDMYQMTAAHKTLPLPSYVEVTNLDNGKKIIVKVNDRGPFHAGRIIDLSYVAALKLDIVRTGTGNVEVSVIGSGPKPIGQIEQIEQTGKSTQADLPVFVQVGSYAEQQNAKRMQTRLADAEIHSNIHRVKIGTHRHVYRVRIGPFEKRNDIGRLLDDLEYIGVEDAKVLSDVLSSVSSSYGE